MIYAITTSQHSPLHPNPSPSVADAPSPLPPVSVSPLRSIAVVELHVRACMAGRHRPRFYVSGRVALLPSRRVLASLDV